MQEILLVERCSTAGGGRKWSEEGERRKGRRRGRGGREGRGRRVGREERELY